MADLGLSVEGVVGRDPASDANFAKLILWIEDCITGHQACCPDFPLPKTVQCFNKPLPRRLIDVGICKNSQAVSLLDTIGQLGSYVALSHCWGSTGKSHWKTTLKTLEDRKKTIDLEFLPKNYQDAIIITRKIGQRFLWIDSLCIIQDSAEDWERESANMGNIYKNSLVTICASGAENSYVGCLSLRNSGPFDPVVLELERGEKRLGKVSIYRRAHTYREGREDTSLFYANVDQCPLANRAWTIQERMLSPRNIHYGKEQIFWECVRQRDAEGGPRFVGGASDGLLAMYRLSSAGTSLSKTIPRVSQFITLVHILVSRYRVLHGPETLKIQ